MSTLAYAALTTKREEAPPGTSKSSSAPGVGNYVDALAAIVPTEVLTLHALILSATTTISQGTTQITDKGALAFAFWGLLVLSVIFYVGPRGTKLDKLDSLRALIPPLSFVAWTMLQRATAFDAVAPSLSASMRTVIGLFLAALVGSVAAGLATQADAKPS